MTDTAARRHLQRPSRAAASDRDDAANSWPACATGPGSRRPACIRRFGVHAPLVFDLYRHLERAVDRRLHVSRVASGGRQYEGFPVNAYEAESRRAARFFAIGHTAGRCPIPPAERNVRSIP